MNIKKLSRDCLVNLVDALIAERKVIGVKAKGDRFDFGELTSANELRLDYDVTLQPPKKCFQPPIETLLKFEVQGDYRPQLDTEPFVLIGVHPYDMVALNQMDEIWRQDNSDSHYFARRNNATVVVVDVVNASDSVFASSMGTATVKKGWDVLLTDIGDGFVAEAQTGKGEDLLAKSAGSKDANKSDLKAREKVWKNNEKNLNKYPLKCKPSDLAGLLEKAYDHPVWEEKAATCFACGSCTQVCPTCYCFNVQDDVSWDLKTGQRTRAWDGCMLDGFTKVAGEHEFRKNRADRFRHRIYRKGLWVPKKVGYEVACVGCGRCVKACLPDIANPVNVYNRLVEDLGVKKSGKAKKGDS